MLTFAAKRRPWAFVMPLIAMVFARSVGDGVTDPVTVVLVGVTGLACGAAWQLLYRRDLVDRLTYFAAAFVVSLALIAVLPDGRLTSAPATWTVSLSGVLAGLVYTEQWLRGRAERVVAASAAPTSPVTR